MSFTIKSLPAVPPTGSIMAYLGTADPEGWVICDGVARTNSDSRFNALNALGVGTGGNGTSNFTPPNLKGSFLRGIGTAASNSAYTGPSSVKDFQEMAMLTHGHSSAEHYHQTLHGGWGGDPVAPSLGLNTITVADNTPGELNLINNYTYLKDMRTSQMIVGSATFGTGNTTDPLISNTSMTLASGSYGTAEVRPYNCGVNWILKI